MIKVLHYIPGFLYGGIESLYLEWYKRLDHSSVEFELLLRTQDDSIALKQYRELNGKYYRLPEVKNITNYIIKVNQFFKYHHDYDIIHATIADSIVLSAAKRYGIKTIVHSHTSKPINDNILKRIYFSIDFFISEKFFIDYAFACSKLASQYMFGGLVFKNKKVVLIHNAIDINNYKYDSKVREEKRKEFDLQNNYCIGHVGRMTYPKNQFFLLDIFKDVLKGKHDSVLLMVGDGPDEAALKKYAQDIGISESVRFLGNRDDVKDLIQAMDLFLLPSRYEGLPVTLIEAQAAGLPCVISDVITEESYITDLIYRKSLNDSTSSWAETICSLVNVERKDMSSQISAKGFDMDVEAQKLVRIYKKICNRKEA